MRLPDPLLVFSILDWTARYANRQSGQVESLMYVGSTPTLVTGIFDF